MRLLNAKQLEWGEPLLLVDQIPRLDTLRFRKLRVNDPVEPDHLDVDGPTDPGYLYVAEHDGYVASFFQLDPQDSWLRPGREIRLHLDDDTVETLVGPWSSGTDLVNRYLPELAAHDVLLTDDPRSFEAGTGTTATGAITLQLWYEIPSLVRSMDKQARQQLLRQANPGGLGVEQIAELSAAAIQRLARAQGDRLVEASAIDEVVGAVEAFAAVPPRPGTDGPVVAPATIATHVVHEYMRARKRWGWRVGRASAWAVGEVVDRLRTFDRIDDAATWAAWTPVERQRAADLDVIMDLHRDLEGRSEASRQAWEAQDAEPRVPIDAAELLAAAPPSDTIPDELFERARITSTGELLAWVQDARHPPERPLRFEYGVALHAAEQLRSHRKEERLVLRGLQTQLAAAGPQWWPGTWRRCADLRARIDGQIQVISKLDQQVKEAEDRVLASLPRTETPADAWEARVRERAVAAVQELGLREQGRFADRVVDPPQHLLQALGPPPADLTGWRTWRAEALLLERAWAAGLTVEGAASPAIPAGALSAQHDEPPRGVPAALPGSRRVAAEPTRFHVHLEDGVAVVDQDAKTITWPDGRVGRIDGVAVGGGPDGDPRALVTIAGVQHRWSVIVEPSPMSPTSAPHQWPGLDRDGFPTGDGPEPTIDLPE